ncbi:hypothetical protein Mycch_2199 [Mycolicibacterium chubuense NBB4]|uniref:Uncharacterized protein n=1 Tax=Mycolicibacterium chubuense (strain NBB4) TaxID=710421 RepID=I4BI75_MYCCN|nr:hypothetical protein Mycch_2199 [Mycolicibacterium chubuense NBB4]
MTDDRADFVVRCEKCAPAPGKLIVKYRWMKGQGHWIPVATRGKRNVESTSMRGDKVDDWWFLHLDEGEAQNGVPLHSSASDKRAPLREHHQIACGARHCANAVAADAGHLEFLFQLIERSISDARKPGRSEWTYLLADLATADETRGTITLTLAGLRAALTLNNAKWVRHTRQS